MAQGVIGDVKHSILNPERFINLNGKGWVLMDGRNINNSDLFRLTGMTMLPDARGVFIRAMNENRDPEDGDSDGNRIIGKYQKDSVGPHAHRYYYPGYHGSDKYEGGGVYRRVMLEEGGDRSTSDTETKETKPRNITLYVYIKINND